MPADRVFVDTIIAAIRDRGGRIDLAPSFPAPNPFPLVFEQDGLLHQALVYVRRATPQLGVGTDHGRPAGEWHTQMIFDDSQRGAGVRNHLARREGFTTVLFGYTERPGGMIIAAWDPVTKQEYGYSRSLQVRDDALAEAERGGLAQRQTRRRDEIVVAFRPEFLPEYLDRFGAYHNNVGITDPDGIVGGSIAGGRAQGGVGRPPIPLPPPDFFGPRRRQPSGERAVRDVRFKAFIADQYEGCAICTVTVPVVLEAAHIIPVADERGSDHPSNGFRLCRNCHRLYDAGLLLIRRDYNIEVAERFERLAPEDAAAYRGRERLVLPDLPAEYLPDPESLALIYHERFRP